MFIRICICISTKRSEIPTKNTLAVKKLQLRPEKGCDEKDVKLKGSSQGLCRNAVDHINFDNDDPGCKTFEARKMFCGLGHHYQKF